jgi:hypothetical protein
MLIVSAVISFVLVLGAFIAARSDPHPIRWGAFIGFAIPVLCLQCVGIVFPVVWLLTVLLAIALRVWQSSRRRWPTFVPLAMSAVAIAYGTISLLALSGRNEYDRVREKYPFESMEPRVPAPKSNGEADATRIAESSMAELESTLDQQGHDYRSASLR